MQFTKSERNNEYACIAFEPIANQTPIFHGFRIQVFDSTGDQYTQEYEIVIQLSSKKFGSHHWFNCEMKFNDHNYGVIVTSHYNSITNLLTIENTKLTPFLSYHGTRLWVNYLLEHVPLHQLSFDLHNIGFHVYSGRYTLFNYNVIEPHQQKSIDELRLVFSQQLIDIYNTYKINNMVSNNICIRFILFALLYPEQAYYDNGLEFSGMN